MGESNFKLSDSLTVVCGDSRVGKNGVTYYNLTLTNGKRVEQFDIDEKTFKEVQIGESHIFDFSYRSGVWNGSRYTRLTIVGIID